MDLNQLLQHKVFQYFKEISDIPRCSHDEKRISDYLVNFAKQRQLEVIQDETLNVIIRKPATNGKENQEPVVLQGHMDMVCEKTSDSNHDFTCDPIELVVDGNILHANQTTLGGDDGIAVAMGLAILDSDDLVHPPLEVLITTTEETGMDGAIGLSENLLKGTRLINIDSEEEGIFLAGCAGGSNATIQMPYQTKSMEGYRYEIILDGMQGGHSGMEIHQPRVNAIKLAGELLAAYQDEIGLHKLEIGTKHNAIPRVGRMEWICKNNAGFQFEEIIEKYRDIEPNMTIEAKYLSQETAITMMDADLDRLVHLIEEIPTGVAGMMQERPGIVETSDNLAIVKMESQEISFLLSLRSSKSQALMDLYQRMVKVCDQYRALITRDSAYPAWEYQETSPLRRIALETYQDMFGKTAEVSVIHAGLECGLIGEKYPKMDMISMGPNMFDVHTPKERLEIDSTLRMYEYLVALLARL